MTAEALRIVELERENALLHELAGRHREVRAMLEKKAGLLEETLALVKQSYALLENSNALLEEANGLMQEEMTSLKQQVAWFRRQIFGSRSERRFGIDPVLQGNLFAEFGLEEVPDRETPDETPASPRRRSKRRDTAVNDSGLRFDESVPVETIIVENLAAAGIPEGEREEIGEKVVCRVAQEIGSYKVLRYVMKTWKRKDTGELLPCPAPANVLERSCADVSFLAGMLVDKHQWHLPLYRQHKRLEAAGITVSRSSLTNWAGRSVDMLKPIFDAQCASVLSSLVIAMDETTIKAGRIGPGKMRRAYFWPIFGDNNEIVFHYAPSREHRHVGSFLGDFEGTLLSDGYQAYEAWAAARGDVVVHAGCWAHARREIETTRDHDPMRCGEALDLIGGLYAHEEEIRKKKLAGPAKLAWRREHSVPIVEAFWRWCRTIVEDLSRPPKDPLLLAVNYARNRRDALEVYLSDPDVPIDTNHLERAIRAIPMGRRNWLFCWSELGAEHVGIIQSLVSTCRMHKVDPYIWLVDVLQRIAIHPARDVAQLTPRLWKQHFAANPLTSDIGKGVLEPALKSAA